MVGINWPGEKAELLIFIFVLIIGAVTFFGEEILFLKINIEIDINIKKMINIAYFTM